MFQLFINNFSFSTYLSLDSNLMINENFIKLCNNNKYLSLLVVIMEKLD